MLRLEKQIPSKKQKRIMHMSLPKKFLPCGEDWTIFGGGICERIGQDWKKGLETGLEKDWGKDK